MVYLKLFGRFTLIELIKKIPGFFYRKINRYIKSIYFIFFKSYIEDIENISLEKLIIDIKVDNNSDIHETLKKLSISYREHIFDILGSGPYKQEYKTVEKNSKYNHKIYANNFDEKGKWLKYIVNNSNFKRSCSIWSLIFKGYYQCSNYSPIDWQLDFKSGYRWCSKKCSYFIKPGKEYNVDIKVPWELGRLQHLPQMALCITEEENLNISEIRAQILDFIATNPPCFGVNWVCPMDVAIRISNILVAIDILVLKGVKLDEPFLKIVTASAIEHLNFIVENLEWSEKDRGNHYLADLVGILFICSYLKKKSRFEALAVFASQQILIEIDRQFHSDGGNFEASTNYHRLSSEIVFYAIALIARLSKKNKEIFLNPNMALLKVRPPTFSEPMKFYSTFGGSPISDHVFNKLNKIVEFTFKIRKPGGNIPQIGDNDSGRLFKFHPKFICNEENSLNHDALLSLGSKLLNRDDLKLDVEMIDGMVINSILETSCQNITNLSTRTNFNNNIIKGRTLKDIEKNINDLPNPNRKEFVFYHEIPINNIDRYSFDKFGLYIYKSENFYLSIRCFSYDELECKGHSHDDNLSIELFINGKPLITDPGSYLYTSNPDIRESYRSYKSHFTPRAESLTKKGVGLFELFHIGKSTCIYFNNDGFAAELKTKNNLLTRVIRLYKDKIRIIDASYKKDLYEYSVFKNDNLVSNGYGKRTENSICSI